jgi:hypothetical protein
MAAGVVDVQTKEQFVGVEFVAKYKTDNDLGIRTRLKRETKQEGYQEFFHEKIDLPAQPMGEKRLT